MPTLHEPESQLDQKRSGHPVPLVSSKVDARVGDTTLSRRVMIDAIQITTNDLLSRPS